MSYKLIDGKAVADAMKLEIAEKTRTWVDFGNKKPHLAAVLVGNDGGSETYVGHKVKACAQVGFDSTLIRHPENVTEKELLATIHALNTNPDIDGFIVQLPLPKHIDEQKVIEAIDPKKDVDGFHPINIGRMLIGIPAYLPATPFGIITLIERYGIPTQGRHCVVLGRSNIVGKPISILMGRKAYPGDCTVTLCHSRSSNLQSIIQQADILIVALGVPGFVKGNMVKDGVVVIDVGTTRVEDHTAKNGWRLKGDVQFDEVAPKSSLITPVPGGVGPMTIVSLLKNTLLSAKKTIY